MDNLIDEPDDYARIMDAFQCLDRILNLAAKYEENEDLPERVRLTLSEIMSEAYVGQELLAPAGFSI